MALRLASVFAGVGGFDLGFERAGMAVVSQVEIDKRRHKVLARNWPGLLKGDDVADTDARDLGRPDVVCGGFPCQDTSIAAPHRRGLAGSRSGAFWDFHRLLGEHLRLVDATSPRWVVIENPPGLLRSHDGRDMAAVVRGLEDLGYGWAYRVVDGRHLGSPQRRQRVLVVGHLGGDPRPAWAVLADAEDGGGGAGLADQAGRPGRRPALAAVPDDGDRLTFRKGRRPRSREDYATWVQADYTNTLTGFDSGQRQTNLVVDGGRPRFLTRVEWERLQGFPDGWCEGLSDSAQQQVLGDAMNVPMASWLGRRLVAVDSALPMIGVPA